jgi:hypothetical protein
MKSVHLVLEFAALEKNCGGPFHFDDPAPVPLPFSPRAVRNNW